MDFLKNKDMYNKVKINIIDYSLIIFGIAICFTQYFYNRSLWLDEAFIANNIMSRNFLDLLFPLDYGQVAPVLFLLFTKLFSLIIPNSELGLRVFPLLSYLFSIIIFYKICKLLFKNKISITFCLSLFVFNYALIYYSSESKQYMSDVFVLLLLYYTTIKYSLTITIHYLRFIVVGSICIFMSNITPIVLLSCGIYLVLINSKEIIKVNQMRKLFLIIFSVWLASFVFYYLFFIHNHPTRESMIEYWSYAFLPNNPFNSSFYIFLFDKFKMIFFSLLDFGIIGKFFVLLFYLIGLVFIFLNKNLKFVILFIIPIVVHLVLSAFKLYPFDTRLALYSSALYIIIITFGFENLINSKYLQKFNNSFINVLIPFLFLVNFFYSKPLPVKNEEIKEVLSYINTNIKDDQSIFVYYAAEPAFKYYQSIKFFNTNNKIISTEFYEGIKFWNVKNKTFEEIKKVPCPLWLVFSHVFANEENNIIQKLDSVGYNRIESFEVKGASVYLFGEN